MGGDHHIPAHQNNGVVNSAMEIIHPRVWVEHPDREEGICQQEENKQEILILKLLPLDSSSPSLKNPLSNAYAWLPYKGDGHHNEETGVSYSWECRRHRDKSDLIKDKLDILSISYLSLPLGLPHEVYLYHLKTIFVIGI